MAILSRVKGELIVRRISARFQYICAKNFKGLKIGTNEADTTWYTCWTAPSPTFDLLCRSRLMLDEAKFYCAEITE